MKVAVIGAGVIGITTAYELSADGHEVTVFEQHQTAAEVASFASGSLIVPGWPETLGAGGGLASLLLPGAAQPGNLRLNGWPGTDTWGWIRRWRRSQQATQSPARHAALFQLARYSQERLSSLIDTHQLVLDHSQGVLLLWRHERDAEQGRAAALRRREWGDTAREIDVARARELEPALNPDTPLLGALELPLAHSANPRQFTLLLKSVAQQRGCNFAFGRRVSRIDTGSPTELRVVLTGEDRPWHFDHVVVCAGVSSSSLLQPLGVQLPLQPVHAHSISASLREPLDSPLSAVIDAQHQVSIARLGQRIRVAGGRRLGGTHAGNTKTEWQRLYRVLMDWFPGAARLGGPQGSVQEWHGAQPSLPDGAPAIGQSSVPRVWLNLGHGASGWSTACGSARALADQIGGRHTDIDLSAFTPARLTG